jgi:MMP 1-O-methyltransferase
MASADPTVETDRTRELLQFAKTVKGFMPEDEGVALFEAALRVGLERRRSGAGRAGVRSAGGAGAVRLGYGGDAGAASRGGGVRGATVVEIGAWCGKSTVYLGAACEASGAVLFSIDHHHGSEENQAGWDHHDREVVDPETERIDTLPFWRRTIVSSGLGATVVGLVGDSPTIASHWDTPVDFCFIDGGHGSEPAWADFAGWAPKVADQGILAIHDVFPDEADGGRPPYELWCAALASGEFTEAGETGSLRLLCRIAR